MLLASAATLLILAATFAVVSTVRVTGIRMQELESTILRTAAARSERRQFGDTRSAIANAAEGAAEAVQTTSATLQLSHELLAAIPFGVFEAIPATRTGTKRVRQVHDETADGVYRAISVVSGAVGDVVSARLKGRPKTPSDLQEQG